MSKKKIIKEFYKWYNNDIHSKNIGFYDNTITKRYLESLNDNELSQFFLKFIIKGGKVQSGGSRVKNLFKDSVVSDFDSFKTIIFEPFKSNFNLEDWFTLVKNFNGFGFGISTIYLNRVNRNKFPILNSKTINALNKLGYHFSSSKNLRNYKKVEIVQKELIKEFPNLNDFYKVDALNHFVIAINKGKQLITDFLERKAFEDILEQNKLESNNLIKKDENILDKINSCESDKSEIITVKNTSCKRNNYLMVLIKVYRNYTCQFCTTRIPKSNGEFYIEACHIKAKSDGGKDTLNNILILCPNCHKKFDYGKRNDVTITDNKYKVTLNGEEFEAELK